LRIGRVKMYNALYGKNPSSDVVMKIIQSAGQLDVPRLRDAYVEQDESTGTFSLCIFTRTGGNNRDCYCFQQRYSEEDDRAANKRKEKAEKLHQNVTDDGQVHEDGCYYLLNERMTKHALYISDEDDSFDSTYAYWKFNVPEAYMPIVVTMYGKTGKTPKLSESFPEKMEELKKLSTDEIKKKFPAIVDVLDQINEKLNKK
jgi:hypothetical protein